MWVIRTRNIFPKHIMFFESPCLNPPSISTCRSNILLKIIKQRNTNTNNTTQAMQVAAASLRRASGVFRARVLLLQHVSSHPSSSSHSRTFRTSSLQNGFDSSNGGLVMPSDLWDRNHKCSLLLTAPFCSATAPSPSPAPSVVSDSVKDVYDKVLESIKVKKSAPPNAWLWSLIEGCKTRDDIKLLFSILKQLRIFRLSNLRIHDNFNCNLCQEVAKACVRSGAVDYGKRTLWTHNVYGLTPTVGSANQLLSYAKEKKDVKLMVDIMSLLKKNDIPLQPGTADIVFSICYDANNWELISKYSRWFIKAGVKLRKITFDVWMEFASKRGDIESLWKIEQSRSDLYKQHTIKSGFSCAKGFLLEQKPDSAASVIQVVSQNYPDTKRQDIINELQKLVSVWSAQVIKHQKQEDQKPLIAALKASIPAMLCSLSNMDVKTKINLDNLNIVEPLPC